jgi:hypothetical protein
LSHPLAFAYGEQKRMPAAEQQAGKGTYEFFIHYFSKPEYLQNISYTLYASF